MDKITISIVFAAVGALALLPFVAQTAIVPIGIILIAIILLILYSIVKSYFVGGSNDSPDTYEKEIADIDMYKKDYKELKKMMKKLKRKSGNEKEILELEKDIALAKEVLNYYKSKLNTW